MVACTCAFDDRIAALDPSAGLDPSAALGTSAALEPLRFHDLQASSDAAVRWIWHGYLAAGQVTLLTSQWKTGKSTLLALLMAKMGRGGMVADLDVSPARLALVTEEDAGHWHRRGARLGFGPHLSFFCRPFAQKPDRREWEALIDRLVRLHAEEGLDVVAIDTLATFLPPGVENQADAVLDVLRSLDRLTRLGVAVLLLHHPRKGMPLAGQAARGSGALAGFADIVVEMHARGRAGDTDRRRRLTAWSRHDETPRELMIELSADGCEYRRSAEPFDEQLESDLATLTAILGASDVCLTREALRNEWPGRKPPPTTLWRLIDRALARGLIVRRGAGRRGEPYGYGLPGQDQPPPPTVVDEILAQRAVPEEERKIEREMGRQLEKPLTPTPPRDALRNARADDPDDDWDDDDDEDWDDDEDDWDDDDDDQDPGARVADDEEQQRLREERCNQFMDALERCRHAALAGTMSPPNVELFKLICGILRSKLALSADDAPGNPQRQQGESFDKRREPLPC